MLRRLTPALMWGEVRKDKKSACKKTSQRINAITPATEDKALISINGLELDNHGALRER